MFLRYKAVPHDPLTVDKASLCLHDLLKGLAQAIQEFHQNGYAHQDIRLENVCFNEQYEPVLIDLDRSRRITLCTILYRRDQNDSSLDRLDATRMVGCLGSLL